MPLYCFKCDRCEKVFEKICEIGIEKETCECGGTGKRITVYLSNFHLKGEGWSKDNYTSKRKNK